MIGPSPLLTGSSRALLTCSVSLRTAACGCQAASCAVALNSLAFAGKVPSPVAFNEMLEPPSLTAARHAEEWCNNVRPVRRRPLPQAACKVPNLHADVRHAHVRSRVRPRVLCLQKPPGG